MIKKKLWSEESDFSDYTEDEEENKEEEDEEENEDEEEENEDEEEEDEEEENEDEEEENEDEEYNEDDEYNEIEEIDEVEKEDDDGLILVEEDVIKQKRKREYILNKKDIEIQKNKFNYNIMTEEQMINNIKQYLEKITTQKNSEILIKNIIDSSTIKNKESKLYRKEILDKVNHLIYFYSGSPTSGIDSDKKSIKEIQTDIKNNNIGFYNTSDNNFWDTYRESIKKEVNKIKQPVEVVDGLYTCSKCKGTITQSYSIQTRRSDEPPTVFIHCMNKLCLHKWREG
jgi:DNA-directed RNA polymerase subunit M/transcription elongation factor TFIIS